MEYTIKENKKFTKIKNDLEKLKNHINDYNILANFMINLTYNNYKIIDVSKNEELLKAFKIDNIDIEYFLKLFYFKVNLTNEIYVIKENYNIKANIEKLVKYLIRFINLKIIYSFKNKEYINLNIYNNYLENILKQYINYNNIYLNLDIMRLFLVMNIIYIKQNNFSKMKEIYNKFIDFFSINISLNKVIKFPKKKENKIKKNLIKSYKFLIILHIQLLFYYKDIEDLEMIINCYYVIQDLYIYYFYNIDDTFRNYLQKLKYILNEFELFDLVKDYSIIMRIISMFINYEKYIDKDQNKANELNFYFNNFKNKFDYNKYKKYNKKQHLLIKNKTNKYLEIKKFESNNNSIKNICSLRCNNVKKFNFKSLSKNKIKKARNLFIENKNKNLLASNQLFDSFNKFNKKNKIKLNTLKSNINCELKFKGEEIKFISKPKKSTTIKKESDINNFYSKLVYDNLKKEKEIVEIDEIKFKKLVKNDNDIFEKRDFLNCKKILNNKRKIIKKNDLELNENKHNLENNFDLNSKIIKIKEIFDSKERLKDGKFLKKFKFNNTDKIENKNWKSIILKNTEFFKLNNYFKKFKKGHFVFNLKKPKKKSFNRKEEFNKIKLVN